MGSDPGIKDRVIYIWSDPSFIPMASHNKLIKSHSAAARLPRMPSLRCRLCLNPCCWLASLPMGSRVSPVSSRTFSKHVSPFPSLRSNKNICLLLGKENTQCSFSQLSTSQPHWGNPFFSAPATLEVTVPQSPWQLPSGYGQGGWREKESET